MWVLSHKDDLDADFMRFFPQLGTNPVEALDGPRYFSLARRVSAYGGVMAARLQESQPDASAATATAPAVNGAKQVDLTAMQTQHPDLFRRVRSK